MMLNVAISLVHFSNSYEKWFLVFCLFKHPVDMNVKISVNISYHVL